MSLGSYIRSAARATFYAYRRVPVRWRLGGGSAALTFVILTGFAAVVDVLTDRQLGKTFSQQGAGAVTQLVGVIDPVVVDHQVQCQGDIIRFALADSAEIRLFSHRGRLLCSNRLDAASREINRPRFRHPRHPGHATHYVENGFAVYTEPETWKPHGRGVVIYARPLSSLDETTSHLKLFLGVGVVGGTVLALLAGLLVAQRAMRPVAELTDATREIERTRDPSLRLPHFEGDDEVTQLARTLEAMLAALDAARNESEAALRRQREFVADASHELRTPLTSVLANLELLADELAGEQADSAKSALRATRRMRRLVGDLLLLARADAERRQPLEPLDLADCLTEAAAEIGAVSERHELTIAAGEAPLQGRADDLLRMILNLLENAIRHTPPGTQIHASTGFEDGHPLLVVEDGGPGIPPELRPRVFERFVRGGGDTGDGPRGSGLGLAIVNAVAAAHGARLELRSRPEVPGTRFEVSFPVTQTSTTTGSTIGRRRSLS